MTKASKILSIISLLFVVATVDRVVEAQRLGLNKENQHDFSRMVKKLPTDIERETVDIIDLIWKNPPVSAKGESWTFDLFTAPTIVAEGTAFKSTLPWLEKSQSTLNFEVLSIDKKIYPLQFSGYFNQPTVDGVVSRDQTYSFMLFDVQTRESLQARLGQFLEKYGIDILSFDEKGPLGEIQGYPQLKVMDRNINREVILTPEKKYYDQLFEIRLRSKVDDKEIFLAREEEEFSIASDQYVLKSVDIANKRLEFLQKMGKDSCSFSLGLAEKNTPQTPNAN
jgi:hypothetical protein